MSDPTLWVAVALAAAITLLAVYFAVSPLLQPGRASLLLEDDKLVELLGRKDATLQAIKDLEFDYRVGKINQEDYQRLDQRLRRQAIGLMQQIEKIAPAGASLDEELESIIARFRQTSVAPAKVIPAEVASIDDSLTEVLTVTLVQSVTSPSTSASSPSPSLPSSSTLQSARFCTQCGKPLEAGHKFCAYCGTPVAQVDPATPA